MTIIPRSSEDIYVSIRGELIGKITKLTNFTNRSFNFVWNRAFSEQVRDLEVKALSSQLSGIIDYAGGPITEEDLQLLGLSDDVSVDDINPFMDDNDLDELVKILGVTRDGGERATGAVDFDTENGAVTIPEGTVVSTDPDSSGNTLDFETTEAASTSAGVTTVTDIGIQAIDVGEEYNLPAGTIDTIINPPVGVLAVNNPSGTTGGQDRESNDDLRARAKRAVEGSGEGGTVSGIKTFIENNVDGVDPGEVVLDEFFDQQPPFVDVIVSGGVETDVEDAIDFSRPAGIRHNLVRPQNIVLGAEADIIAPSLNSDQKTELQNQINTAIQSYLDQLDVGEDMFLDALALAVAQGITFSETIIDIDRLNVFYETSVNESYVYDVNRLPADQSYRLDYTYDDENGTVAVRDSGGNQFTEGTDYQIINTTPDGLLDTIQWIPTTGTTPEDRKNSSAFPDVVDTRFFIDYNITVPDETKFKNWYFTNLVRDESFFYQEERVDSIAVESNEFKYDLTSVPFPDSIVVTEGYLEGRDFTLTDENSTGNPDTINWDLLANTPDDGDEFTIEYGGNTDTFTFSSGTQSYTLSQDIESDYVLVTDENSPSYVENIDWQLSPRQSYAQSDEFTFDVNQRTYTLSKDVDVDFVAIIDDSGDTYIRDTDYETIDVDNDTYDETIRWQVSLAGAVADDGGSTTDETTEANDDTVDDMTLLPASPETGDAYYFGHDDEFKALSIDISTEGAGTWSIVWEYYDGTTWSPLSNITDGTDGFQTSGNNFVEWDFPTDWVTTDVGGITETYWVRARVDAFTSISTQPLGAEARIGRIPTDGTNFDVNYDAYPTTIVFDQNNSPPSPGADVFFQYDQQIYEANETIAGLPNRIIISGEPGDTTTHNEGTDFEVVDIDNDRENDSIRWISGATIPDANEKFCVTYATEPNAPVDTREKIESGTITINITDEQ